jgi:hypothetical protein
MENLPKSVTSKLYVVAVKYSWRNKFDIRIFDYEPKNTNATFYSVLCTANLSVDLPVADLANVAIEFLGKEKEGILQDAKSKVQMIDNTIKSLLPKSEE